MKRFVMVAAGAFVLVACSHQSEAATQSGSPASAVPHVVFYAEGEGTKAGAMTLRSESGGTIQKDVALPLVDTSTGTAGLASDLFRSGDRLYISVQNKEPAGSVTCRIVVDGKKIDEATSSGPYKVVSCVGKVP